MHRLVDRHSHQGLCIIPISETLLPIVGINLAVYSSQLLRCPLIICKQPLGTDSKETQLKSTSMARTKYSKQTATMENINTNNHPCVDGSIPGVPQYYAFGPMHNPPAGDEDTGRQVTLCT